MLLHHMLFLDALGNMCVQDSCSIALGAGVRPIIEMNKTDFLYSISAAPGEGGTIEVTPTASEGDTIVFKPISNNGYEIQEMYIVTETGDRENILVSDVTIDEDGSYTINPEKYKMPDQNIVIHVNWFTNPKTGIKNIFMIMYGIIVISIIGYFVIKNNNISL
jgi:hypothetical protein